MGTSSIQGQLGSDAEEIDTISVALDVSNWNQKLRRKYSLAPLLWLLLVLHRVANFKISSTDSILSYF